MSAELDVFRCELDGINLIEASAGTGKTWNLCGLYLRLLLERELEVQRILVVTFTKAATAELRERIRARIVETLDFLADARLHGGDPFVPELIDALLSRGMNPGAIAQRLDLALQTFDEAAIFTIHGFCQRALTDTPFAAGLPMSLELLQDDSELLLQSVHDFWRRNLAGKALPTTLAAYLLARKDKPEKYAKLLKRHLAKPLATCLWPADGAPDDVALDTAYTAARSTWLANGAEIVALLLASLPALNANTYKEAAVRAGGRAWDELFRADTALAPLGEKCPLYRASRLADRTKKQCATPRHPFFDQAEVFLERRETLEGELAGARLHLLRDLLREAGGDLRELKRSRRVVSFDDLLFNLHERLTNGLHPWLAPSLKARFPAALIDEFQDTDPLQFDIFHRIYGAADRPLFLVGDPKQAIYSFRHADLHTYLRARQQATAEYSLVANQRSSEGLITALNTLFSANPAAFLLPGLDYHQVEPGKKPRKSFTDRTGPHAELQLWMLHDPSMDAPEKKSAREAVVAATAAEIARLIDAAAAGQIELDGKALRPGDIATLVRSHAQGSQMKQALARLGIGSVELSLASVFQSVDAEEVERVLRAIREPGRERLVRAALATELLGCDAGEIEAVSRDETLLTSRLTQFDDLRSLWLQRGFGVMYRRLLASERVAQRLLARPDGERRLTNLLHLGECLHQAAEAHASPEALLRFLEARRRDGSGDETAQLRLESDQNLVQIVTIHKSKGLEYPIVFCPFLWDGRPNVGGEVEGAEYHDDAGRPVIDMRGDAVDATEAAHVQGQIRLEQAAETQRLIYVALTRAVYRCYLVTGCYSTSAFGRLSATESGRSMLNWLAVGRGQSPQEWFVAKPSPADISAAWAVLAQSPHIHLVPLPVAEARAIARAVADPESLTARTAPARIPGGWRVSSYSGLSHGAISEQAASDHDARVTAESVATPVGIEVDDILRFPRGAVAGDCVHAVFEHSDFTRESSWAGAIAAALSAHPQPGVPATILARSLHRLVKDVTETELLDGVRLNAVTARQRMSEFEFNLPARNLAPGALNEALKTLGYPGPRLTFNRLEGYLKGFIDLVFEQSGRFFILDWKSNHLGCEPAAYGADRVAEAMAEHGYHLQSLLYTVALDRYLRLRIPGYRYELHFGGVLYLFVRGVRPTWKMADGSAAGVHFHRPDPAAIDLFNALLESDHGH